MRLSQLLPLSLLLSPLLVRGHDAVYLPAFEVNGSSTSLHGAAMTASQGYAGESDLENLTLDGTGGVLEAVPGMTVTQHSASGKANQYFLRGFNLDHGTDFAVSVDGMQVNLPSHGHGQGYADMNFVIPEFISLVSYLKGPYYAMMGDFSSAGSASIGLKDILENSFASLSLGEYGYERFVGGQSLELDSGDLLLGLELESNNGPWDLDEDLKKKNGMIRFTRGGYETRFSLTAMAYSSSWDATDQIPGRLVESGEISEFGYVDPTVGGRSSRYSLSANWRRDVGHVRDFANGYVGYYDLNLWSNFTYFLEDPENGDQFEQADRRTFYGFTLGRTYFYQELFGKSTDHTIALSGRWDDVDKIGLYHTVERQRIGTVREDSLGLGLASLAYEMKVDWNQSLRAFVGARLDHASFDVESDRSENSGTESDWLFSPKFNLVFAPNQNLEWYLSLGRGFHSNDARGTTITVDPNDGVSPVDPVDPLVASEGWEVGGRFTLSDRVNTSVAFWFLTLDSELLYVGDAGVTEASLPSRRSGVEWSTYFALDKRWSLDFDLSMSDAAFVQDDGSETYIPGVVEERLGGGLSYRGDNGFGGAFRVRHVAPRPLVEDGSVYSPSSTTCTAKIEYVGDVWRTSLEVLNVFDARDYDIAYYYESRLQGEATEGVADLHYHIMKPQTFRITVERRF